MYQGEKNTFPAKGFTKNQTEAQRSGFGLERRSKGAERIAVGSEEKARPAYEKALRPFHRLRAFSELERVNTFEEPPFRAAPIVKRSPT